MGCGRSRLENDYPDPNAHLGKPNPVATFETTMGIIKAEIFMDRVPRTASNFIDLCRTGFYNGVHFRELSWPLHEPHTPTVGSVGGNVARQFCSLHPPVHPRQLCTTVGTLAQPCRPAALRPWCARSRHPRLHESVRLPPRQGPEGARSGHGQPSRRQAWHQPSRRRTCACACACACGTMPVGTRRPYRHASVLSCAVSKTSPRTAPSRSASEGATSR